MTDTIPRQAVIDAVRSVPPGTTCRGDAIIAAINAIPAGASLAKLVGKHEGVTRAEINPIVTPVSKSLDHACPEPLGKVALENGVRCWS